MRKTNILTSLVAAMAVGLGATSCSDWLEVQMEDQVMENVLFSDYPGYMTALNGVYLSLNDLYATTSSSSSLSVSILDVLAQYYNVTVNNAHVCRLFATYDYGNQSFETRNSAVWSKYYEILANDNLVIEHCRGEHPLSDTQHAIICGEALALRAWLHFDLLRLYGPIYSDDPDGECIPYQGSSKRQIEPFLSSNRILELISADLDEAESLLRDYDPIITEGVKVVATEDNGISAYDMSFRQLRFNYYAVKLLQARVALWKGDKAEAYRLAKRELIDKANSESLTVFPWATKAQVQAQGKPDLLFSSEVIFSIYHSKRSDIYTNMFSGGLRALSNRLTFVGSNYGDSKMATFYDDTNDLRRGQWKVVDPNENDLAAAEEGAEVSTSLVFTKYADFDSGTETDGTELYRYMVPLMRLSEAYIIAAECTADRAEALELLNTLRFNRSCIDLDPNVDIDEAVTAEFAREVIGEGQLFFFYKRRAEMSIMSGTEAAGKFEMSKPFYTWPIPQSELDERAANSK